MTLKGKYYTTGIVRMETAGGGRRSPRSPRGDQKSMGGTATNFGFTARSGLNGTAASAEIEKEMAEQPAAAEEEEKRAPTPPPAAAPEAPAKPETPPLAKEET